MRGCEGGDGEELRGVRWEGTALLRIQQINFGWCVLLMLYRGYNCMLHIWAVRGGKVGCALFRVSTLDPTLGEGQRIRAEGSRAKVA